MRAFFKLLFFVAGIIFATCDAQASWLSDITGINIDVPNGTVSINAPRPQDIPEAIQHLPNDIGQALLNPAAPILATAIRVSRNHAFQNNPQPLPSNVKAALAPYFPQDLLEHTRWTTANGGLSLSTVLGDWLRQEDAITLDDIIVFQSGSDVSNIGLWAHELTHALQYRQMGVDSFAFTYSFQFAQLEQQARSNASMIVASLQQGRNYNLQVADGALDSGSQMNWAALNQAAQQVIDPRNCIWINGLTTGNRCPRTIVVTGIVMVNAYGQQQAIPCTQVTCIFQADQQGPLISPPGWQVIGVTAAF